VIVTYKSSDDVTPLMASLRIETDGVRLRVIVADNDSKDSTVDLPTAHSDATVIPTGGNLSYSGVIGAALRLASPGQQVLVVNPDRKVRPRAIGAMVERLLRSGAELVSR
jgi:GT2 family glycosyltransferase